MFLISTLYSGGRSFLKANSKNFDFDMCSDHFRANLQDNFRKTSLNKNPLSMKLKGCSWGQFSLPEKSVFYCLRGVKNVKVFP